MIKDLLNTLFGIYQPITTNVNVTLATDHSSNITSTVISYGLDWLWLGKFALFCIFLYALLSFFLTIMKSFKR